MKRLFLSVSACSFLLVSLAMSWWFPVATSAGDKPSTARDVAIQDSTPRLKAFMRKKLRASQQVVEGLATENRELITAGAASMIDMSKEAIWDTRAGAIYTQDTADFVRTAERIVRMSKAKDVEGAALAYAQLTLQCVHCHRHVRSEKIVLGTGNASNFAQAAETFRASQR